ncbi:NAD+ diphosphatase [Pseudonocardia thermophila]|uniref:NAD(+) diphosphatase n=1 Tax=Pseudonocardia thermophila TaxID=1848 RepID=A0A1M6W990_PSETH|nr:NAD(+) diphosphatase [Pseudonocardia thermophila]SHK90334.1 NAD+ diphosphatase [Pseudonocardia thermophila]
MTFRLTVTPVLSRNLAVRDDAIRADKARQEAGWPTARLVVVDDKGRTPVVWSDEPAAGFAAGDAGSWDVGQGATARLRTRPTTGSTPAEGAVLLGEYEGVAYWGMRGGPDLLAGDDPAEWADLRMAGAVLDPLGAGLFVTACALLNWHDTATYCPRDGSPMRVEFAGWHRVCEAHGHEEYPRTDPSMIVLVHDGGTGPDARVLLARQPVWPAGRFSVLAGFVEAGESLEACVLREVREEVGVEVRDVTYLGSQAWPFPRSLMVAFQAVADSTTPLRPAEGEIEEAMWVTRAELQEALAAGDWGGGGSKLLLPGKVSIARAMLESWAAA